MALITTDTLAELCPFFGNGVEKLKKASLAIDNTQRELLPILCKETYDELVELHSTGYLSGDWQSLYDLVVPWLAWASWGAYLPLSQHTDTDAGLRTFIDENSNSTSDAQLRSMISQADSFAESYKSDFISFVQSNVNSFPEYKSSRCNSCKNEAMVKMKIGGAGNRKSNTQINRITRF